MNTSNTKPKFIVIEGSEGAGKSTQMRRLAEYFGDKVVTTREPGGSPYAEEIRNVILKSENAGQADARTHFALFWASRADHMKNTVLPALLRGQTVLTDRFDSSTYAYQIFGQGAEELKPHFFTFRDFFLGDNKPDLYIFLKVPVEVGLSRKQNQPDELNHFEARKIEFFDRMQKGFDEFLTLVPSVTIDATPSADVVFKELVRIIEDCMTN